MYYKDFIPFYNFLKIRLDHYQDSMELYMQNLPDFFLLLTEVLKEECIDKEDRIKICSALGYFVIPNNIITGGFYGGIGYKDYMFICCKVLNKLVEKHGYRVFDRLWTGTGSFRKTLLHCYQKTAGNNELSNYQDLILSFIGFL